MMRMLAPILLAALAPAVSTAAIIDVPGDQPTIQEGLDAAAHGDTVLVADGVWTGPLNVDLDPAGKPLLIASASNDTALCRIDCQGSAGDPHRGFWFHSGEDSTTVVRGFTIENGWADSGGGAVLCDGGSPKLVNCRLAWNESPFGAGLCVGKQTTCVVDSCAIAENIGDGAYVDMWSVLHTRNSVFTCNRGDGLDTSEGWDGPYYFVIADCGFTHNDGHGIHNRSTVTELCISDTTLSDNGDWGMWSWNGDYIGTRAQRCVVQRNGRGGLWLYDYGSSVHETDVSGNRGPGIMVSAASGIDFSDCDVYDNDGSGLEVIAFDAGSGWGDATGPRSAGIHDCRIHDNGGHGVFLGLFFIVSLDACSIRGNALGGVVLMVNQVGSLIPMSISGNTIVDNGGDGLILEVAADDPVQVTNNIVALNAGRGLVAAGGDTLATTNNDLYGNQTGDLVVETGTTHEGAWDFSSNPLFVDLAAGDLTLAENSPCLPGNHPAGYQGGLVGSQPQGGGPMTYAPAQVALAPDGLGRLHLGQSLALQMTILDAGGTIIPDEGVAPTLSAMPGAGAVSPLTLSVDTDWVWSATYTAGQTVALDTLVAFDPECVSQTHDTLRIDVTDTAIIRAVNDIPDDQGRQVRLIWDRDLRDDPDSVVPITQYVVWRRVDDVRAVSNRPVVAFPTAADAKAGDDPPFWRHRDALWEPVGPAVPAMLWETYASTVPTLADSTVHGVAYSVFQVSAHTLQPHVFFVSAPDSGYSVDDLEPGPPVDLLIDYAASGNTLVWQPPEDPDVEGFLVHRSGQPGFEPGPDTLVHATGGSSWHDDAPDPWSRHYAVVAVDFAGNPSRPAYPVSTTGLSSAAPPSRSRLLAGRPNPFNPRTTVHYHLGTTGHASLRIHDLQGKLVRTLVEARLPAGDRSVTWDGLDGNGRAVPTGMYVCRLVCADGTDVMKLLLVR